MPQRSNSQKNVRVVCMQVSYFVLVNTLLILLYLPCLYLSDLD